MSLSCSVSFAQPLLQWYEKNKRDLPWRDAPTPYNVLVSEIMLQQTQVSRVIEKYVEFLSLFPTLKDLAEASRADVIKAWSGLGYNRRALLLHRFAQAVMEKYKGEIPSSPSELRTLPGIGSYTAGSIVAFAFNHPEPALDVNVRRIFSRFFHGADKGLPGTSAEEKELSTLVRSSIPTGKSSIFHNALMDFGSLVCTRDNPSCSSCPLVSSCRFAPLYKEHQGKVLCVMEKKQEPGKMEGGKHIPNRIFRGRIVEFARNNEGTILFAAFGKAIKKDYGDADRKWLEGLCQTLQDDGLLVVAVERGSITLKLPQ